MKKVIVMLLTALPFAAFAQQKYSINGTIGRVKLPATAYVVYQESGRMNFDSAAVQPDGQFSLKGVVSVPMKAYVMVSPAGEKLFSSPSPDQTGVYLENGHIEFSTPDSMIRAKVGGTPLNQDQQEMVDLLAPFVKKEEALQAAFRKAKVNSPEYAKTQELLKELMASKEKAEEKFIKNHPNSLVSLNLLRVTFRPESGPEKASTLFNTLSPEIRTSKAGEAYLSSIGKAKVLDIGNMAPDFTFKNPKGEDVSLSSFKGKYVLVDFWASWCIPCRQENPNVVKNYEKFKAKNFTILGVSLDGGEDARKNWTDAIAKDGLNWEQVSDLRGWGSYATQLFHINAIPANFLLDPTGKIIGKNLRGEELGAKLSTIL